ncbi:hypothetical protein GPECTOR_50g642 [Gonium pectorale]|uniref:3-hydroxyisobutyryl-CoA hydrolase n=1 Tax=Gonium pectorale TaxID=33097 RepID=A0A150G7P6_GONPE|nr:hypothetical protein GPECTOR_50g642 [Gonium pectorale]|eukprot:KXZ45848.1 hypothetical protein GPECTOR_50g642 [Gonium pectorale]
MASTATDDQTMDSEVLLVYKGTVACVTLNRPKALNSLSLGMVRRLLELNTQFAAQHRQQPGSASVSCVVVRGAGGKAFCAGGDVKELVLRSRAGDPEYGVDFFRTEYANNAAIAELPVPYIAVLDGIVMGGGVGVSYHGHFRIATERTVLAMPETGIGLFPDVGAAFFLPRLPGHLGRYMGLTGERIAGECRERGAPLLRVLRATRAEVKDAGFATHFIPSAALPDLEQRLAELGPAASDLAVVDRLLRSMEAAPQPQAHAHAGGGANALLDWKLPLINAHFGRGGMAEVVASLEAAVAAADREGAGGAGGAGGEALAFVRSTLAALKKGSPLSQAVTWEMLRRSTAGHLNLRQCLELEYVLAARCTRGQADFIEGVRALLIDKDNRPRWRYGSVAEVPERVVREMFEPLPGSQPLFGAAGAAAAPASRM